jgi:hypothetical protein
VLCSTKSYIREECINTNSDKALNSRNYTLHIYLNAIVIRVIFYAKVFFLEHDSMLKLERVCLKVEDLECRWSCVVSVRLGP